MAPGATLAGADPLNLWGNAREGSEVPIQLQSRRPQPPPGEHERREPVALEQVGHSYRRDGGHVQALEGLSLRAGERELLAVVGASGCGKTTLLELICGLQQPDSGTVRSRPAALMPQRDLLLPWLDASENAGLALRIAGTSARAARERAGAMFAELGLDGFQRARPHELSGGMRQRVAFLRTLLSGKPVLCLDEPFGALDAITRGDMQDWLAETLSHSARTVVLVTHDVEEAILLADRVAIMAPRPGRIGAELEIGLGRPRRRSDPRVMELRERALRLLAGDSA
jgi:ABC-type nitrate/sulfonate/bicarbonate transport system ATPase subunit